MHHIYISANRILISRAHRSAIRVVYRVEEAANISARDREFELSIVVVDDGESAGFVRWR